MTTSKSTTVIVAILLSLCCGPHVCSAVSGASQGMIESAPQASAVRQDDGRLVAEDSKRPSEEVHASDEELFALLTANVWAEACVRDHALPPSCSRIELRRDGTYQWLTRSDYVERNDTGRWNFRTTSADSGMLLLSDTGAVRFRLTEDGLEFAPIGLLHRDEPLRYRGSRHELAKVTPPNVYSELVKEPWLKANDFSSIYMPDRMQFERDGTVALEFRGGECKQQAAWSVYRTSGRTRSWLLQFQPELCDLRVEPNPGSALGYHVKIADDMLVFGEPYYREGSLPRGQKIVIEQRTRATGSISDRLVAGSPVALDLTLENTLEEDVRVDSVVVSLEPLALEGDVFKSTGAEEVLATIKTGGKTLKNGEMLPLEATMTPTTEAKWAQLSIRINGSAPWRKILITTVHAPGAL